MLGFICLWCTNNNAMKYAKYKAKLVALINEYGYWSEQVKAYNDSLPYHIMSYINNNIKK